MREKHERSVNPELCSCLWTTPLVHTGIQTQMAMLRDWQLQQPSRYKQVTLRIWNSHTAEHALNLLPSLERYFQFILNRQGPILKGCPISPPDAGQTYFNGIFNLPPWCQSHLFQWYIQSPPWCRSHLFQWYIQSPPLMLAGPISMVYSISPLMPVAPISMHVFLWAADFSFITRSVQCAGQFSHS